jgi:hypothetical protein
MEEIQGLFNAIDQGGDDGILTHICTPTLTHSLTHTHAHTHTHTHIHTLNIKSF